MTGKLSNYLEYILNMPSRTEIDGIYDALFEKNQKVEYNNPKTEKGSNLGSGNFAKGILFFFTKKKNKTNNSRFSKC